MTHSDIPFHKLNVVFVVGAGHSGTTILYRMLALHPDFAWFSQYSARNGEIPERLSLPGHRWLNRLLRKGRRHDWRKSKRGYLTPRPSEAKKIWNYILPKAGGLPVEESIERMRRVFESECQAWGKSAVLVKQPRLTAHMDLLRDAFPQASFVHIIRDGRAVALSQYFKSKLLKNRPGRNLEEAAAYWMETVDFVRRQRDKGRVLEIRYEDFCEDVHSALREIQRFCGLDWVRFPYDRCPRRLTPTNSKRIAAASETELAFLERRLADTLRLHRY